MLRPEVKTTKERPPRRPTKRWIQALTKSKWNDVKVSNEIVEAAFIRLLSAVKTLYKGSREYCYEHNSRHDNSENSTVMHTFITKSFFLELECFYTNCQYYVYYDFDKCPFEKDIRAILNTYPLNTYAKHQPQQGGVAAFFKRVEAYQGGKRFYYL